MWLPRDKIMCSNIEPLGCYNTGFAPSVVHKRYPVLGNVDMYLVGCETDVCDHDVRVRACTKLALGKGYCIHDSPSGRPVYVYKTMAPARRRYNSLCAQALEDREREAREVKALRAKAEDGDLASLLALGDY